MNHKKNSACSVYQEFKARGYNDCELFGITYLSPGEQRSPAGNYHNPRKYDMLIAFIEAVKIYTGKDRVDIVAHSLGVSMALAALTYEDNLHRKGKGWAGVRRVVNIAGGVRGCLHALMWASVIRILPPAVLKMFSINIFLVFIRIRIRPWVSTTGPGQKGR